MKKLLVLAVIASAAAAWSYTPAFAGCGCGGGGGGGAAAKGDSFAATNQCPLAQKANELRSIGRESAASSVAVRTSMAAIVQRNLAKI